VKQRSECAGSAEATSVVYAKGLYSLLQRVPSLSRDQKISGLGLSFTKGTDRLAVVDRLGSLNQ